MFATFNNQTSVDHSCPGKLCFHDPLIPLTKQTSAYNCGRKLLQPVHNLLNNLEDCNVAVIVFTASITACLSADVNERGVETGM